MGGKLLGSLLSAGIGLATKPKAPKVSSAAVSDVTKDQETSRAARASLYSTQGGALGEELDPNQVKKRDSLLGN